MRHPDQAGRRPLLVLAAYTQLRLARPLVVDRKHLGGKGANINDDIATLVANGLPVQIPQALDSARVYGNSGAHPGGIDLRDDLETVLRLFKSLNLIVDRMITQVREVQELFEGILQAQLDQIQAQATKRPTSS